MTAVHAGAGIAGRPRIVLVPNVAAWIVGDIGRQISRLFGDRFDFFFLPESLFFRRADLVRALLPSVDLIHCLNESAVPVVLEAAGGREMPPIVTWIHHVTRWSSDHDFAARHSGALVASTPGWKREIEGMNPHQCTTYVVRYGVDSTFYHPRPEARAKLGLPADAFLFGFFGAAGSNRDGGRKGIPVLMEVVRAAAERVPGARFVFGGPGWDETVRELQAGGIAASATGFLRRSDMPALYSALDAYLMTARVEGGPCTILEAMACGTPVVATRVGLVPDVVEDGVNGFTAEIDDVQRLVDGIIALATDRSRAKEMAKRGRATAEKHSWTANLEPLGQIYRDHCRPVRPIQLSKRWMRFPDKVLRPASAADALADGWDKTRRNPRNWRANLRTTRRMLEGLSAVDCVLGAALLKGLTFRG
jgi:glycosyltransferase involved in cell wall biosynthesis